MCDSGHLARRVAFVRIIDPEDRSLERIRYVKIAASIEGKSVGRRKIILPNMIVSWLSVRVIYLSIGRRAR